MYNTGPRSYQFPAGHGAIAESYVRYQMYSNLPQPAYDARLTQYIEYSHANNSNAVAAVPRDYDARLRQYSYADRSNAIAPVPRDFDARLTQYNYADRGNAVATVPREYCIRSEYWL